MPIGVHATYTVDIERRVTRDQAGNQTIQTLTARVFVVERQRSPAACTDLNQVLELNGFQVDLYALKTSASPNLLEPRMPLVCGTDNNPNVGSGGMLRFKGQPPELVIFLPTVSGTKLEPEIRFCFNWYNMQSLEASCGELLFAEHRIFESPTLTNKVIAYCRRQFPNQPS